jgi:hypothetical protein
MEVVWSGTKNGREAGTFSLIGDWARVKSNLTDSAPATRRNGKELPSPDELRGGGIVPAGTWAPKSRTCACGRVIRDKKRNRCWGCLTNDRRIGKPRTS